MIKIGFIHFDGIYLLHHFINSAAELYKDDECEVDILTSEVDQEYLYYLLELLDLPKTMVKALPTYYYKKIAYKIQDRKKPSHRYIFKKHKKRLLEYDILVFTVFNHVHIKRTNRNKPKFVMLMHGAGDRDYPFLDIYKEPISKFDLITTPGQKINDLFDGMGTFSHTKFEICGYQKFDLVKIENNKKKLFQNNKPTVLYNPHFREYISSFHKYGIEILDFFYNNKNYNLVFAPHFNLFDKDTRESLDINMIDQKYKNASNIKIDFGSINSVNMSYTLSADIYLGDLSSQVYEFLINKTNPCIFINANNHDWKNDKFFQTWKLGKVYKNTDDLGEVLKTSDVWQKEFEGKQKKAIEYTFDISEKISSSKRVANAIKDLIKNK